MDNVYFKETILSLNKSNIVWITLINKGLARYLKIALPKRPCGISQTFIFKHKNKNN